MANHVHQEDYFETDINIVCHRAFLRNSKGCKVTIDVGRDNAAENDENFPSLVKWVLNRYDKTVLAALVGALLEHSEAPDV